MKSKFLSPFLVLCAAVCFSLGGLLVKLVPWHPLSIGCARSAIAALELLIYMKLRGHRIRINRSVLIGGIAIGATSALYVCANKLTTAANTILLQYTAPVFIILLSWILFSEKPDKIDVISTVVLSFGVVLFFLDSLSTGGMLGNILALTSGVTYAVMFMMKKFSGSDTLSSVLIGCLFGVLLGLPWLVRETDFSVPAVSGVCVIGLIQFGLAYICMAEGLQKTPALTASLISMVEPILNPILVAIVLSEKIGTVAFIGAVIVIGGVLVNNILKARQEKKTAAEKEA